MRVRLDNIDHALVRPGPLDESTLPKVPVIRIYGLSSTGQRACLHVHQVYPYFFVNYYGPLNPDKVKSYIHNFTKSLNHGIALSLHRNPHGPNAKYIRAIILVKGVPFYGFHTIYQPFLKILVADPSYVSRTVTILQSGSVMKTKFTTYESHLSYYLQFMCDFSLYGCGWVDLGEVFLRGEDQDRRDPNEILDFESLPKSPYFKESRLPLELDICSHQIQNRHLLESRDIHSSLRIPAPLLPPDPLIHSVRELWEDERRRRISNGLSASPDMPKILSEHRRSKGGDWTDLERLQKLLTKKCDQEKTEGKVYRERNKSWEKWVMSTFESVEALWGSNRRIWRPKREEKDGVGENNSSHPQNWSVMTVDDDGIDVGELDVDESMLSSQGMNNLVVADEERQVDFQDREDDDEGEDDEHGVDPDNEAGPPPEVQFSEDHDSAHTNLDTVQADIHPTTGQAPHMVQYSDTTSFDEHGAHALDLETNASQVQHDVSGVLGHQTHLANPDLLTQFQGPKEQSSWPAPALDERLVATALNDASNTTLDNDRMQDVKPELGSFLNSSISSTLTESGDANQCTMKRRKIDVECSCSSSSTKPLHSPEGSQPALKLSTRSVIYARPPPRASTLLDSIAEGTLYKEYRDPYYSVSDDLPERPRQYAGLVFDLTRGSGAAYLPPWNIEENKAVKVEPLQPEGVGGWEYASWPPSKKRVIKWLDEQRGSKEQPTEKRTKRKPHLDGQTQNDIYGFKTTQNAQLESTRERQYMSVLALEVFAKLSGQKVSNPSEDEIVAVFYSFQDEPMAEHSVIAYKTGIITVDSEHFHTRLAPEVGEVRIVSSELDLINDIIDKVLELDPDILAGWEIQAASWGYLETRGKTFGLDVSNAIGRAPIRHLGGGSDEWGMRNTSTLKVAGRHVLNVWRIMRVELSLNIYSFENVVFQVLNRRVPKYSASTLTEWFNSPVPAQTARVLRYFMSRTCMLLEVLETVEVVTKTAEFARVFGIDFFSVISRGSQFKVESFMFRMAKPEGFVFISPSKSDVGKQNAAECMPLIMEPYSAFYKGPVVVLDFQSLYPSVMIAYNYCYSTCLGRVQNFKGKNKFGVTNHLENPNGLLNILQEHLTISPNGMVFVKPEVRKGLLGKMLTELLDTRVMVKQAMKGSRGDKALLRVLEARQLSLKYIANVTYGYTSASFSGRMPAVEIADAIVQSGRETLEKAIGLIESTNKWGARVVYGDTDSLFIYLQGRTKEQAFLIGNEIADKITAQNPAPIKLKFEKVYLPCVLMAKKRYVGFKYELPDDEEPAFDAKGIETVRRDGVPAQKKMVEKCLKILFRSQDLSMIKEYCQKSWKRILEGSVSTQDFIFAKEVRLGTYSDKIPPPPGAAVAAQRVLEDANNEPQYGERIPYVIARGEPGMKLVDRAVGPEEVLHNRTRRIDAEYYITKVLIPPLERIFNLVGADVRSWYDAMGKGALADNADAIPGSPEKPRVENDVHAENIKEEERGGMETHYRSSQCILCGTSTSETVCQLCRCNPEESLHALQGRLQEAQLRLTATHAVCVSCTGSSQAESIKCESLDCPWLYARDKAEEDLDALQGVLELTEAIEAMANEEGNNESLRGTGDSVTYCMDPLSDCDVFL